MERERERERESVLQKKIKLEMSSFAPGREVDLTMLDEFGPVGTFLFFSVSTFFWIVRHSTKLLKNKTDGFVFVFRNKTSLTAFSIQLDICRLLTSNHYQYFCKTYIKFRIHACLFAKYKNYLLNTFDESTKILFHMYNKNICIDI